MDILKLPLFLFFLSSLVHSKKHCPPSYCSEISTNLPIKYPFKLQNQHPQNCTYYTDLTCNDQGMPVLSLPYGGDFNVRRIYYEDSIIQLYDPRNCMPRRLLSLNFSALVAMRMYFVGTDYTFYSCPSEVLEMANLTSIDCMSNSKTATVATYTVPRGKMTTLYRCDEIVTLYAPFAGDFIGNQTDFILFWDEYPCGNCPKATTELVSSKLVGETFEMMALTVVILPSLICIGCCASFAKLFRKEVEVNS